MRDARIHLFGSHSPLAAAPRQKFCDYRRSPIPVFHSTRVKRAHFYGRDRALFMSRRTFISRVPFMFRACENLLSSFSSQTAESNENSRRASRGASFVPLARFSLFFFLVSLPPLLLAAYRERRRGARRNERLLASVNRALSFLLDRRVRFVLFRVHATSCYDAPRFGTVRAVS